MRKIGYPIIALASFCLTALGSHALLPLPEVFGVTQKIRFIAEHGGDYDTLFVGSSHDWERTALIMRKILEWDVPEKSKQKRRRLWRNRASVFRDLLLFGQNLANFGRGFDLLGWSPREDNLSQSDYEPRGDGYAPAVVNIKPEKVAQYEAWVRRELVEAQPREVDRYAESAFRYYAQAFRSAGAIPIFFVTPGSATFLHSKVRDASLEPVLAFNNPARFPGLYRPERRIDEGHLNAAGAEE